MLAHHRTSAVLVVVASLFAGGCDESTPFAAGPLEPSALAGVDVVPTLDTPLEGGTSAWCATFPLAWAELARVIRADGPVELDPALDRIDGSPAHTDDLVPGTFFVAAGRGGDGITTEIRQGVEEAFGHSPAEDLTFPPSAYLAYAQLQTEARFPRTYRALEDSIEFVGVDGTTEVVGFGLDERDRGAYSPLREQVGVLFRSTDEEGRATAWAVDLDTTNEEVEIVVAHVPRLPTLADAVAYVRAERPASDRARELGPNDTLRVPNVALRLTHRFTEFEGARVADGQTVDVARQDIVFRLDRTGARLTSRSRWSVFSGPTDYTFDRPFLLMMSRRGAPRPFFAMWIEDAAALEAVDAGR